jgi:hypothetical protein
MPLVTVREHMHRACSERVISRSSCSAYITCVNFCHLIPDGLPFWIVGLVTTYKARRPLVNYLNVNCGRRTVSHNSKLFF